MVKLLLVFLVFLSLALPLDSKAQEDSSKLITLDFVFNQIKAHHPLATRADLLLARGKQTLRSARGGFDPELFSYNNQKVFKGDRYYFLSESGLKVPTWFGMSLKGTFENHDGYLLNPENTVPADGQFGLGLSVTALQGLIIDERRAVLKQAKLYNEQVQVDRVNELNDLLLDAAITYYEWMEAYYFLQIVRDGRDISLDRFNWAKESYRQGDIPAIDTLETYIQWQSRELDLLEATADYQNASLRLSNFLWLDGYVPLELDEQAAPPALANFGEGVNLNALFPDSFFQNLERIHPQLLSSFYKIEMLDVERRLKAEKLKPKLNLEYAALSAGPANNIAFATQDLDQNYKLGINFSMPLLLREGRGDYQLAKIKLQEAQLELSQKALEVRNKVLENENLFEQLIRQQVQAEMLVGSYEQLLIGEQVKFRNGESSVFLINSREVKFLESRMKYVKLSTKLGSQVIKLRYIKGDLASDI